MLSLISVLVEFSSGEYLIFGMCNYSIEVAMAPL